jgi:hypothetical protein
MMRLLCVTALAGTLVACQTFGYRPDIRQEMTSLLEFHQTLAQRDDEALMAEADQLRDLLVLSSERPIAMDLRLLILESQLELRELQRAHGAQLQQIESLTRQIEALTAIEQQINRRGQLQETVNE